MKQEQLRVKIQDSRSFTTTSASRKLDSFGLELVQQGLTQYMLLSRLDLQADLSESVSQANRSLDKISSLISPLIKPSVTMLHPIK